MTGTTRDAGTDRAGQPAVDQDDAATWPVTELDPGLDPRTEPGQGTARRGRRAGRRRAAAVLLTLTLAGVAAGAADHDHLSAWLGHAWRTANAATLVADHAGRPPAIRTPAAVRTTATAGATVPVTPSTGATARTTTRATAPARTTPPARATAVAGQPPRRAVTTSRRSTGLRAAAQDLRDLAYATRSNAQRLDLYLPDRVGVAVPLVVYIHGGAFSGGDKADPRPQYEALRTRGYAVAAVNYRLSGEARFPAGAQDVKAAVRWLRAHAGSYGVDPARFAAWGESAGGYLAAVLGTTGDQTTLFDDPTLASPRISGAVQAVVDWYGPTDFLRMDTQSRSTGCSVPQVHDDAQSPESLWLGAPIQTVAARARQANPITYLAGARTLPPFLVAHGDADCNVPHGQSQLLVAALRKRSAAVTFTLIPKAGHGDPVFEQDHLAPAIAFLDRTLRPR